MQVLRKRLSVLLQGARTFPGTIFANISAIADVSAEEALTAAKLAAFLDVIEKLPMWLYTIVTDKDAALSTGGIQRLLLARCFASKPDVMLLDEPLSSLDGVIKNEIISNLLNMPITRIIITHDLSLVKACDNILVMDTGRIVESGDYKTLIDTPGYFRQCIASQLIQ